MDSLIYYTSPGGPMATEAIVYREERLRDTVECAPFDWAVSGYTRDLQEGTMRVEVVLRFPATGATRKVTHVFSSSKGWGLISCENALLEIEPFTKSVKLNG